MNGLVLLISELFPDIEIYMVTSPNETAGGIEKGSIINGIEEIPY